MSCKAEKLSAFLKAHEYLPKQGSKEWLESKKGNIDTPPTIGGSEMFQLVHAYRTLAETKLIGSSFTGNMYTYWGNIFEEVINQIFNMIFSCISYETGSIPGLKFDGFVAQTYSPDGLMLITKDNLLKVILSDFNQANQIFKDELPFKLSDDEELIVLNEFKCPSIDIPDGFIPKKYQYQPPTGMVTIPIVDLALFCNSSFRRCGTLQFDFNGGYINTIHTRDPEFKEASFIGLIGFYETPKEYNYDKICLDLVPCPKLQLFKHIYQILRKHRMLTNSDNIIKTAAEIIKRSSNEYQSLLPYLNNKFITELKEILEIDEIIPDLSPQISLEEIMKEAVSYRYDSQSGYRTYYHEPLVNPKYAYLVNRANNDNPAQYLQKAIESFTKLRQDGYRLIGYMPWKLFKCCIIPMYKDPDFLEPFKEKIKYLVQSVYKIKQEGAHLDHKIPFYEQELEKYFGAKKKSYSEPIIKSPQKSNDNKSTSFLHAFTDDEF